MEVANGNSRTRLAMPLRRFEQRIDYGALGNRATVTLFDHSRHRPLEPAKILYPLAMICSDGGSHATYGPLSSGSPHPRAYGTFPRLLGRYVRERGDMPLATAIHKVTGMPAAKLRLRDRGVVRVGAHADLVAFDPSAVADAATFSSPHQYPHGIPMVIVNGQVTIRDGEHTGALAGRPVFGSHG